MRRIKLILAAAASMVLMMTVVALPTALAKGYYWDPSWLGSPASTDKATIEKPSEDWECGWLWDPWEEELVWACWED